jgi:hypothetical protein
MIIWLVVLFSVMMEGTSLVAHILTIIRSAILCFSAADDGRCIIDGDSLLDAHLFDHPLLSDDGSPLLRQHSTAVVTRSSGQSSTTKFQELSATSLREFEF